MTEKNNHFEVVVLGSGPGGYAAAFRAADLGKNVALIEKDAYLGGVCLNRGCIPSKALLHIAQIIEEANELEAKGVKFGTPKIDIDRIRKWKEEVVEKLNKGIAQMAKARKVRVFTGIGELVSASEIVIKKDNYKEKILFENAIIATGSRSTVIPTFPMDNQAMMTSREALQLENIPKTLLVVGGGYIGLEMASVYSALGTKVTVVEMLDSILPGADKDIVRLLQHKLKRQFESILVKSKVTRVTRNKDKTVSVTIENNGKELTEPFEKVLVSVGRRPNTENIGLEKLGVKMTERGFIKVDNKQQTNIKSIYAIGDVAGDPMLAHKATHEGKVAAEVIAGLPAAFDAKTIPAVIFTNPEVAWTGLTENEAQAKGVEFEKAEFLWGASGKAIATGHSTGKTKILFDPTTHKVLGVSIVGPHAGDIISEGALAIEMGADAEDISLTIHPHPTLSETFANAAEVFSGTVTDIYVPKKAQVTNRSKLRQFFGVGPIGVLFTVAIWASTLVLEKFLNIPQIQIHPILRTALITVFTIDALYLLIGSSYQIKKQGKGDVLMTKGPYQFIRHPIYSAWVYSFTGILSMVLFSWAIILSVIPINLFWSWLVTYEENKMLNKFGNFYKDYMSKTGQFLPSWKNMKENLGENPD